jgi:imidazolonepropionase-like amidohydrolase
VPLVQDTIPAAFIAALRQMAQREKSDPERAAEQRDLARLKERAANAKKLCDAGILIAAGTDAPYPGVFQREGLHQELELLVEAGLRPLDAISLATRNAARHQSAHEAVGETDIGP